MVNADHTVALGTHSIALPPLPGHSGYAAETVELSHQLDGTLRIYRGDQLLAALPLPLEEHAQRRPALITSAQKRKPSMPRMDNLSGRPVGRRYLIDRGDTVSLQLSTRFSGFNNTNQVPGYVELHNRSSLIKLCYLQFC